MAQSLFQRIEGYQGGRAWGRLLDAGTGWGSLDWALALDTEGVVAVTGSGSRQQKMKHDFGARLSSRDSIVLGNWAEPDFLAGETFDTVLVDYLVGAIDRFAPYYQTRIFERLKPHVAGRLYIIGLEPYPEPDGNPGGQLIKELVALRDSAILLAGDRPHREYPRWWVREQLLRSGYQVQTEEAFPILYGEPFVRAELDVCRNHIPRLPKALRAGFEATEKDLRSRLLSKVEQGPIAWGADYIIVAECAGQ